MGRVRTHIEINGRKCWTLFDTGARNTYIIDEIGKLLVRDTLDTPRTVPLGGKVHQVTEWAMLKATVEGRTVEVDAYVTDKIGKDEDKKPIEILFGALAMQKWGIKVDPQGEKLDMSCYPEEFVEF